MLQHIVLNIEAIGGSASAFGDARAIVVLGASAGAREFGLGAGDDALSGAGVAGKAPSSVAVAGDAPSSVAGAGLFGAAGASRARVDAPSSADVHGENRIGTTVVFGIG
ncbi:hypothetical protein RIF29_25265 [Crotalaria pallida]|uniref:Uncharacterized protein n=1 Tax=Crotalaria pallida TaxID=3830 RepID=A0AAN9ETG3_CROPI